MHNQTDSNKIRDEGLETLGHIGNEHRISILRELTEADEPLPFSELRRRVGIEDTGQFNYHLTELRGRFVRKSDGRYELGHAGERVIVAAGDLDPVVWSERSGDTGHSEEACPVCGRTDCERLFQVHLSGLR